MQQVKSEQKNTKKDRREGKGRVLAISRRMYRMYRIQNTDVYYVESASNDNIYYFVKYNPSENEWCSCKDYNLNRTKRCKHIFAIEFAIRWGILKDTDKLSHQMKNQSLGRPNISNEILGQPNSLIDSKQQEQKQSKSYKDDDYDF